MRIVIDMQGYQGSNQHRGLGRYTLAFAQAVARNRGGHEIILALSGLFPDTIDAIREAFDGLLPQENIRVWHAPDGTAFADEGAQWRRQSAELVREAFLASLSPDVVHIGSLFEGLNDDVVTSIGRLGMTVPTAVTVHDLIPYVHREHYLENPTVAKWYYEKIEFLRRASLWLAISDSSKGEAVEHLDLSDEWVVNCSEDVDPYFRKVDISSEVENSIRARYSLNRPFIMYTGGIDYRKNVEGLISAFSLVPPHILDDYQLIIVCSVQLESRDRLESFARKKGLTQDSFTLTGFVSDEDLRTLYNLCSLFVFPSLHEGFGLPILEAMRCGAPVIGANTSSIPEVIGTENALFDPRDEKQIAAKITRALTDNEFRVNLVKNGEKQSKLFSWDKTANTAIAAMERLHNAHSKAAMPSSGDRSSPKLAYVSPLPPMRSGIAYYSAQLLPELARHYQLEIISTTGEIEESSSDSCYPVRSVDWFLENGKQFDRVLYHFGNSEFHQHMFELLKELPGVVVLHDFFLSGIVSHMDFTGVAPNAWAQELYSSHGYKALRERFTSAELLEDLIWKYPCSLSVIQSSLGVITHSPNSLQLARHWYGGETDNWSIVPLLRDSHIGISRDTARAALRLKDDELLVCAFGMLGPSKLNHRLIDAWKTSSLARERGCKLVFVGEMPPGDYERKVLKAIRENKLKGSVLITGWVSNAVFQQYLAAADIAVQLRSRSRGESSAAVLDCMNHGVATIVNANGTMADLDVSEVWKLPDEFTDHELIEALEKLKQDGMRRATMGKAARSTIVNKHNPRKCGDMYREAIETFYHATPNGLPEAIAALPDNSPQEYELMTLADSIARSLPLRCRTRQLMVDISELVQRDSETGIARVVKAILKEWLYRPPQGIRVEPVYATLGQSYSYARRFTAKFMGIPEDLLRDDPVEYAAGDLFLALDLQPHVVSQHRSFYKALRHHGVKVKFLVYDLLCVLMPQYFFDRAAEDFNCWLDVVSESDGAICISQSVADELSDWIGKNAPERLRPFPIDWFHLGADFKTRNIANDVTEDGVANLNPLISCPTFLMVGTLEPRKAHSQVLGAFEQLWESGHDVKLLIVGKQGWMVEKLVRRLRAHPELNKRLIWLDRADDNDLEVAYMSSTCLIAASFGEGFGLPLIEAAQHGLPIIARDIAVFREVAKEYAWYFEGDTSEELKNSVISWLDLFDSDAHPMSGAIPYWEWDQATRKLTEIIMSADAKGH